MAEFQGQTLSMQAGTGYVLTLPSAVGSISILARAECYVQLVGEGVAPSTPTVAAVPSAGASTSFYHMMPNEEMTTGIDPLINQQHEFAKYVAVWAVGTGNLTLVGVVHK